MKITRVRASSGSVLFLLLLSTVNYPLSTFSQGTAFTYQGRLNDGASPASGTYDLRFTVYDSTNQPGVVIAGPLTNAATGVTNGLFTVTLDFGPGVFTGPDRWLEISVRTNGAATFGALSPRQKITPAPYAITAINLASVVANNTVNTAAFATVGGGYGNSSVGLDATIGGGYQNTNVGPYATVAGGYQNFSSGAYSTLAGGAQNTNTGSFGAVGGGYLNASSSDYATVSGGRQNIASGFLATVGGGFFNHATGIASFIGGGGADGTLGLGNFASGPGSVISGGTANSSVSNYDTVGGGYGNSSSGSSSTVGGGYANTCGGPGATIGGGHQNTIQTNSVDATISGGERNRIGTNAVGAAIGGGVTNQILGGAGSSTISGGNLNLIQPAAVYATIGGGQGNICYDSYATVGGGYGNWTVGGSATVSGGNQNSTFGLYATVPGGFLNSAGGNYSFAAGNHADAGHQGAFVWADSQPAYFSSTANDQFSIRAAGGVRLNTDTGIFFGSQTRQMLNLWDIQYGIGVQAATEYFRSGGDFCWFKNGVHNDATHNPGGGTEMMRLDAGGNLNVRGSVTANSLVLTSDRNAKENFEPVNCRQILNEVAALPVARWNYKTDASTRHLGPMAQDFHAAFDVGGDDRHIAVVDEGGVALAAIQGLNQKLMQELNRRDAENAELESRLSALEELLAKLNQKGN